MTFYKQIAKHYHKIFPITKEQIVFIEKHIKDGKNILDIACGDGGHAIELAQKGYLVTALDSSKEMIDHVKEKAEFEGIDVGTLNCKMDEMSNCITGKFDAAICLGNSLVHLDTEDRVLSFLKQLKMILQDEGIAIIQIINYTRILNKQITQLPTIKHDGEAINFERFYEFDKAENKIIFNTKLEVEGKEIIDKIMLLPLVPKRLGELLEQSGLQIVERYGGYDESDFIEDESYHFICIVKNR